MTEYVLTTDTVQDCIDRLVALPIHRHLPGYLCLRREAGRKDMDAGLDFEYTKFFENYFRVADGDKPYFVPFTQAENPDWAALRFNNNVAGTYAQSSLRSTSPLYEVAYDEGEGYGVTWSLHDEHWILARTHLCDSEPIPVEALSAFLFRDYAFSAHTPNAETLVDAFCEDFYYGRASDEFQHLYETGTIDITPDNFTER
jgi:hypothetical protein